jgi:tetratricopeptide (TPR) repeat protein
MILAGISSLNRAEEARERGEYKEAAMFYERSARIFFWRADLYEQAGIAAAQAGEFPRAVEYFKKGSGFTEEGWVWRCTSYIQIEENASALSVCNEGAAQFDSARLFSLLAYIHRGQKDWEAERLALENQVRLDASDAYAAYRLGLLLTLSDPQAAIPELNRASTLNPEVDSAVQTLRAALAVADLQAGESMKKVVIGQAFGLLQDWELAKSAFEQAIQLDQKNAEAWAWLGEAKQQTGAALSVSKGQIGAEELNRALSLNRESVNVRALRALYWNRQGKYEQMLAEYLIAAGIEPQNPQWRAGVGEAYSKNGDLVAALEAYQRAAELAPGVPEYWRLLALFCADYNVQLEEIGLPAAQRAASLAPDDPAVLDALGYVYLSTGRFASAEGILLSAIERSPEYFPAHIHLAMTYLAQGNRAAAYDSLVFVRDADGAGVYAETAKQLLEKYFP